MIRPAFYFVLATKATTTARARARATAQTARTTSTTAARAIIKYETKMLSTTPLTTATPETATS